MSTISGGIRWRSIRKMRPGKSNMKIGKRIVIIAVIFLGMMIFQLVE